jgi:hypothetical protein
MCCLGLDVSVITSETCFNKPLPSNILVSVGYSDILGFLKVAHTFTEINIEISGCEMSFTLLG